MENDFLLLIMCICLTVNMHSAGRGTYYQHRLCSSFFYVAKVNLAGRVYFHLKLTVHNWGKPRQDHKARAYSRNQCRNAAYLPDSRLSYSSGPHALGIVLHKVCWTLLYQLESRKCPMNMPIDHLIETELQLRIPLLMCQVDKQESLQTLGSRSFPSFMTRHCLLASVYLFLFSLYNCESTL